VNRIQQRSVCLCLCLPVSVCVCVCMWMRVSTHLVHTSKHAGVIRLRIPSPVQDGVQPCCSQSGRECPRAAPAPSRRPSHLPPRGRCPIAPSSPHPPSRSAPSSISVTSAAASRVPLPAGFPGDTADVVVSACIGHEPNPLDSLWPSSRCAPPSAPPPTLPAVSMCN
jgi:hypothetical protein